MFTHSNVYTKLRQQDHKKPCLVIDKDQGCVQKHGMCQPTYMECNEGQYVTGLCNGYNKRQCCVPARRFKIPLMPPINTGAGFPDNCNMGYLSLIIMSIICSTHMYTKKYLYDCI